MTPTNHHITVVGAGLAGLTAAIDLHDAGHAVALVDGADRPGGRVRTDRLDGFLLDQGFQVFNTAYPEARRLLDLESLGLGRFEPGALVRVDGRFHRLGDPLRRPRQLLPTLRAPIGTWGDKARVLRLRQRLRHRTTLLPADTDQLDEPLARHLDRLGFSSDMIDRFLRPLFAGITLDADLTGSSRVFEFVFAMLGAGEAAVPARGMGAIPKQLADRLPTDCMRLGTPVVAVDGTTVELASGERIDADAVVLATDADTAGALAGPGGDHPPTSWRGVTTWWFAADRPPLPDPVLLLDGSGDGPIVDAAVMSNANPSYAPPGLALIAASAPTADPDQAPTAAARHQLARWYPEAADWVLLRTDRIPHALPAAAAPLRLGSPRLGRGRYLAGDHTHDPSINGAMASGRRAARAVLADLGAPA